MRWPKNSLTWTQNRSTSRSASATRMILAGLLGLVPDGAGISAAALPQVPPTAASSAAASSVQRPGRHRSASRHPLPRSDSAGSSSAGSGAPSGKAVVSAAGQARGQGELCILASGTAHAICWPVPAPSAPGDRRHPARCARSDVVISGGQVQWRILRSRLMMPGAWDQHLADIGDGRLIPVVVILPRLQPGDIGGRDHLAVLTGIDLAAKAGCHRRTCPPRPRCPNGLNRRSKARFRNFPASCRAGRPRRSRTRGPGTSAPGRRAS